MRIGMTMSRTDLDAPPAEHFGKARWLLVAEDAVRCDFVRNEGLDGRSVAEVFAARGCTDVIVRNLGPGAYAHVTAAGIRVWHAEEGESARALVQSLREGRLRPLAPGEAKHGRAHHGGDDTRH
jgi:predicted Fe-Mo cluster-binding NifX family protein